MALIKCNECGKEFSDNADSCPNCACPTIRIKEHILNEQKIQLNTLYEQSIDLYETTKSKKGLYELKKNFESLNDYKDSKEKLDKINIKLEEYKKKKISIIKKALILIGVILLIIGAMTAIKNMIDNKTKQEKYILYANELKKIEEALIKDNYIKEGNFDYYSDDKCKKSFTGNTGESKVEYYYYQCEKDYNYYNFHISDMRFRYMTDSLDYVRSLSNASYMNNDSTRVRIEYNVYTDLVTFILDYKSSSKIYTITFNKLYENDYGIGVSCSVDGERYNKWRSSVTGKITKIETVKIDKNYCTDEIDYEKMGAELDKFRDKIKNYIDNLSINFDKISDYIESYGSKEEKNMFVSVFSGNNEFNYEKNIVTYSLP